MAQEIYLYRSIDEYTAESVNKQFSWMGDEDVNIRIMTRGGYTSAGAAMINKMTSHKGHVKMYVDGDTSSMGAFMLLFADEVEMSDMAELMFHKAAYPSWYTPTAEEKENLDRENKRFRRSMEQRLGEAGKELIEKVFEGDKRNDVYLTAAKAKKLGIVSKVIKLKPSQKAAFQDTFYKQMLSLGEQEESQQEEVNTEDHNKINSQEMTDQEVKLAVDKAREEGFEAGKQAEYKRVEAWLKFAEVDPQGALKGASDKNAEVDMSVIAEMSLKKAAVVKVEEHQADNAEDVNTSEEAKTAEQIEQEAAKAFVGSITMDN